jgi:glycerate 2-kinase
MSERHEKLMRDMFAAAVSAAQPHNCMLPFLPAKPKGRTIIVGAGKASAAMAQCLEQNWNGPLSGLIVTRYGHAVPCQQIEIVEAAHPVPDGKGADAAARMLDLVGELTKDDLVIALMSGGASSLLPLPVHGVSLEEKRDLNRALLKSGVPIAEMNCVRKHLSRIKGGRLAAAAYPARVVSLIISDVPGDDLAAVGSGPTVPDPTTFADALTIIQNYKLDVAPSIIKHLHDASDETLKPGDHRFVNATAHCIASPQLSLIAAAELAKSAGYYTLILGDAIEGEARELGIIMAGIAQQSRRFGQPAKPPVAIISGGETSVTMRGGGIGGRNVEYLLSLALKLNGAAKIYALAADTDGVDGAAEIAGAVIDPTTLTRAKALGIDPVSILNNNDAHTFFASLKNQIITGPTHTNVNDFRVVLIDKQD